MSSALGTSDTAGADLASKIVGLVGQGIKTSASASASASGKEKRQLSASDITGFATSLESSLSSQKSTYAVAEAEKAWKVLASLSQSFGASPDAGTKLAGKIVSQVDKSIKAGVAAAGGKEKMQLADFTNLASSIASSFAKSGSGSADALALAEAEKVCQVLTAASLTLKASNEPGAKVAGKIVGEVEESLRAAAKAAGIKKRQLAGLPVVSTLPGLSGLTGGASALPALPGLSGGASALPALPGLTGSSSALPALPGLSSLTSGSSALPALTGSTPDLSSISDLITSSLPNLPIV